MYMHVVCGVPACMKQTTPHCNKEIFCDPPMVAINIIGWTACVTKLWKEFSTHA